MVSIYWEREREERCKERERKRKIERYNYTPQGREERHGPDGTCRCLGLSRFDGGEDWRRRAHHSSEKFVRW